MLKRLETPEMLASRLAAKPARRIVMVYQADILRESGGGGIKYVQNLADELSRQGERVLFLGAGGSETLSGNIHFVPLCGSGHGFVIFLIKLFLYCLRTRLPAGSIVHVHRLYFGLPFLWFSKGSAVICSLHGWTFWVFRQRFGRLPHAMLSPVMRRIEAYVLRRLAHFVPVSRDTLSFFQNNHPKVMAEIAERTTIIPSMVDLSRFQPANSDALQKRYGHGNSYVLFLGRLAAQKNLALLFEAWQRLATRHPDAKLVLVGHGEQEGALREKVAMLGLSTQVIFHGLAAHHEVPGLLNSASGLVLPSVFEASPTVIKESLACGLPVVTTDVGDVRSLIEEGVTGRIVTADSAALADGLEWLLSLHTSKAARAEAASGRLQATSPRAVTRRYRAIYQTIPRKV